MLKSYIYNRMKKIDLAYKFAKKSLNENSIFYNHAIMNNTDFNNLAIER